FRGTLSSWPRALSVPRRVWPSIASLRSCASCSGSQEPRGAQRSSWRFVAPTLPDRPPHVAGSLRLHPGYVDPSAKAALSSVVPFFLRSPLPSSAIRFVHAIANLLERQFFKLPQLIRR